MIVSKNESKEKNILCPYDLETLRLCQMSAVRCFTIPKTENTPSEKRYYINGQDHLNDLQRQTSIIRLIQENLAIVDNKAGGRLEHPVKLTSLGKDVYAQLSQVEKTLESTSIQSILKQDLP